MTSMNTQSTDKRSIKPKKQYSPSDPSTTALYHLIRYDDNRTMMIVANSSVKKSMTDGTLILNDNRVAKRIISGRNILI